MFVLPCRFATQGAVPVQLNLTVSTRIAKDGKT
jgi:hypothetical protein